MFFLPVVLLFSACNKDRDLPAFDIDYLADVTFQAGLNSFETHNFLITDIPTQRQAFLNGSLDGITRIAPQRLNIQARNIGTYEWIEQIEVYAYTDTEPEVLVAFYDFVPQNTGASLELVPSAIVDMKEHFATDFFSLKVKIRPRYTNVQSIDTRLTFSFNVFTD